MKRESYYRSRAARARRAVNARESVRTSGGFAVTERVRGKTRTRVRAIIIGTVGPQGGMSGRPEDRLAWRIRNALRKPPIPPVTIYDAQGRPVATMDPLTRKRTSL